MILKNSSKMLMFILTIFFIFNTNVSAAKKRGVHATINLIGQEYYMNRCSSCHGEGNRGGNMASIREWKSIFSKDAEELIYLHSDEDETIDIIKYMKSSDFKKESKLMLELLQEFAYDSENIPTCN